MNISKYQKEFILEYFFKNDNYHGWRNIASKLIDDGHCIIGGRQILWYGGVGNFIETSDAPNAVECTLCTFDLRSFINTNYFKDIYDQYVKKVLDKKNKIDQEYAELLSIMNL